MTKKQLAALNRIVEREQSRNAMKKQNVKSAGVHPLGERFALTDGNMVVVLTEKPEGFADAERMEVLEDCVRNFTDEVDGWLVKSPPTVEDCKQAIREWKQETTIGKYPYPKVCISTKSESGEVVTGWYNAQLCLDVLDATGSYRNVYLAYGKNRTPFPALVVYKRCGREDWHSLDYNEPVILLPLHIR